MSRSYKKKPFWSICGWCSSDKVVAGRMVRNAHKSAIKQEWKYGDFSNFLLPHRLECRFNEVYSWASDGRKYYHGANKYFRNSYAWKEHLYWREVTEEEVKVMDVEDVLDGDNWRGHWDYFSGDKGGKWIPYRRRNDWLEYKDWPPLWWRKMMRK